MNTQNPRHNMVEQQIRPWEVLDSKVLNLMENMDREAYVPAAFRGLAYADIEIPLNDRETMLAPKVVARMIQALAPMPHERVLEIGTGSGYSTGILAGLCRHVVSLEIDAHLHAQAANHLKQQGVLNITLVQADGRNGYPHAGPYDAIAVTGSMAQAPTNLIEQLNIGGRLFVIVGRQPVMTATLITRVDEKSSAELGLFETAIPPLQGCEPKQEFVF